MRIAIALGGATLALGWMAPAFANTLQECISLWAGLNKTNQTQGIAQQDFMAACLAHKVSTTLSPPPQAAPIGTTCLCRDDAYTAAVVPLAGCDRRGGLAAPLPP